MANKNVVTKAPEYAINRKQPGLISRGIKSAVNTMTRIGGAATAGYCIGDAVTKLLPGLGTVGMTLAANEIAIPAVKALALSALTVIPPALVLPAAGAATLAAVATGYSLVKGAICGGKLISEGIRNRQAAKKVITDTEATIEGESVEAQVVEGKGSRK